MSRPSLIRNVLWNFGGQAIPIFAALACIPLLISGLGPERFGVLAIVWAIVGYLSFLDLGLGRALTKAVAQGQGDARVFQTLASSGLLTTLVLGLFGGVLLMILEASLQRWLGVPSELTSEFAISVKLLAVSLPCVTVTAGVRGVLEGRHMFAVVNIVRIPLGVLTFVAPVLALPISGELPAAVGALVLVRMGALVAYVIVARRRLPEARRLPSPRLDVAIDLMKSGGWMTVSNVVGPLMVFFDRFVVGAVLGLAAVTYYTTPYEIVTKLLIVPAAIAGVLFPVFAVAESAQAVRLMRLGVKYLLMLLWPIVALAVLAAAPALDVWLGGDFGPVSGPVLKWLALGVLFNSLAFVPFAYLQAAGRADWVAKLHLLELPLYFTGLWWCLQHYGIEGAAVAWTFRALFDGLALFGLALGELNAGKQFRGLATATAASIVGVIVVGASPRWEGVGLLMVAVIVVVFAVSVRRGIGEDEWRAIKSSLSPH